MRVLLVSVLTLIVSNIHANAACECKCVDGKNIAVCTSASELRPYCAPTLCPYAPPNLPPATDNSLPPAGMTSCSMKQVYNDDLKKYEWKRVCT